MKGVEEIINSFPGYEFVYDEDDKRYHNMYRGVDVGLGGYVYAEPGMYENVALLDVASMHPHSIMAMNCFGEYTQNYKNLIDVRLAIKHKNFDAVRGMFDGKLSKYLADKESAKMLSNALKLPINGAYGLTAANFENPFRDIRNRNNIVALRGALFMKTLQDEVQLQGFKVCHIKTDSIKIPNATPEIIQFCMDFGKKYGYTFEHEATYSKMCLVNDAVYIAKYKDGENAGKWTATGKQFQIPYTFKTLFSKEDVIFEDLCETKEVKSALYLDMNEGLKEEDPIYAAYCDEIAARKHNSDPELVGTEGLKKEAAKFKSYSTEELENLAEEAAGEHDYHFVGKVGSFCPIKPGCGGGLLMRENEGKYYAATGTKGYRWLESESVKSLGKEEDIDYSYHINLANEAIETISQYGDFEWFVSEDPAEDVEYPPWIRECGRETCVGCNEFRIGKDGVISCNVGYDVSDLKSWEEELDDDNIFIKR